MSDTADLYIHHKDWKSWDDLFVYSLNHSGCFEAELSAAVIRHMIPGQPFGVSCYAGSRLYRSRPFSPVWVKRSARCLLQKAISGLLRFACASGIPYDPVVVIVLQKSDPA